MGRKSALDLSRDEHFRREAKYRKALGGPFTCPKCHKDHSLSCQSETKDGKQFFVSANGEEKVKWAPLTTYILKCHSCWFTRITRTYEKTSIIDEYNRIYDEELSQVIAERMRKYNPPQHNVLRLRKCEVRMRP